MASRRDRNNSESNSSNNFDRNRYETLSKKLQRSYQEKNLMLTEIQILKKKIFNGDIQAAVAVPGSEQGTESILQTPEQIIRSNNTLNRLVEANIRAGTLACIWCIKTCIVKKLSIAFNRWKHSFILAPRPPQSIDNAYENPQFGSGESKLGVETDLDANWFTDVQEADFIDKLDVYKEKREELLFHANQIVRGDIEEQPKSLNRRTTTKMNSRARSASPRMIMTTMRSQQQEQEQEFHSKDLRAPKYLSPTHAYKAQVYRFAEDPPLYFDSVYKPVLGDRIPSPIRKPVSSPRSRSAHSDSRLHSIVPPPPPPPPPFYSSHSQQPSRALSKKSFAATIGSTGGTTGHIANRKSLLLEPTSSFLHKINPSSSFGSGRKHGGTSHTNSNSNTTSPSSMQQQQQAQLKQKLRMNVSLPIGKAYLNINHRRDIGANGTDEHSSLLDQNNNANCNVSVLTDSVADEHPREDEEDEEFLNDVSALTSDIPTEIDVPVRVTSRANHFIGYGRRQYIYPLSNYSNNHSNNGLCQQSDNNSLDTFPFSSKNVFELNDFHDDMSMEAINNADGFLNLIAGTGRVAHQTFANDNNRNSFHNSYEYYNRQRQPPAERVSPSMEGVPRNKSPPIFKFTKQSRNIINHSISPQTQPMKSEAPMTVSATTGLKNVTGTHVASRGEQFGANKSLRSHEQEPHRARQNQRRSQKQQQQRVQLDKAQLRLFFGDLTSEASKGQWYKSLRS